MYSPKIDPGLVGVLYHTAKDRKIAMTKLVNRLLSKALTEENLPLPAKEALATSAVHTEAARRAA